MPKIMVVDDDPDIRYLLRKVLGKVQYNISEAGSGEECLEKLGEVQPDLIFLDIMMPGIDGWEVCRLIKEKSPQIPRVAILSVRNGENDIKRSMEYARADAHIGKPVKREELLDTARRLLDNEDSSYA